MIQSFDYLRKVVGLQKAEKLKEEARQYKRFARIDIEILKVYEFTVGKTLILVQVQYSGDKLTESELIDRALGIFKDEFIFNDPNYVIDVQVIIKNENSKYALTHGNTYLVAFGENLFVGAVMPGEVGIFGFPFNGTSYGVVPVDGILDMKRVLGAMKWLKHELIERKKLREQLERKEFLTIEDLKTFFADRPSISPSSFSMEAGFADRHVRQLLSGERRLTDQAADKLLPVMKKYGFQFDKSE